jgi:hypothetical protein
MSASVVFLSPAATASTAVFTALCKAISDQMDLYIPVTSDTGQTAFTSTVGALPTINTYPYYQIRRLNDATQSTYPIIIKIEFGYGSGTQFGMRISVATTTNGAGTLTGTPSSFFYCGTLTTNALLLPCFFSGDGSRFQMLLFNNDVVSSTNTCGWSLGRLRDNTGAYVTTQSCVNIFEGSIDAGIIGTRSKRQQTYVAGAPNPTTPIQCMCAIPNWGLGALGLNVGYNPIYPILGYPGAADYSVLMFLSGAVPPTASRRFTLNIYGAPHNYIGRAPDASNTGINGNTSPYSFAFLFE